jgi:hypothetical protein
LLSQPQQHWPKALEVVEPAVPAEPGLVPAALEPVELALPVLGTRVLAGLLPAAAAAAPPEAAAVMFDHRGQASRRSAVRRLSPIHVECGSGPSAHALACAGGPLAQFRNIRCVRPYAELTRKKSRTRQAHRMGLSD